MLDLPFDLNISLVFNVEDLTLYHGTFEPPLSIDIPASDNPPKAPILPQHRDEVEVILDDRLVASTTSITQHFLIKWHDGPTSDAT